MKAAPRNKPASQTKAKQSALRVAFDTPVLLAALLRNDASAKALRASWQAGTCRPVIAKAAAQALMTALAYPGFALNAAQQQELLADFLPYAEVLPTPVSVKSQGRGAHLDKLGFLSPAMQELLAAAGESLDVLVSDTKALVPVATRRGGGSTVLNCRILASDEFLAAL